MPRDLKIVVGTPGTPPAQAAPPPLAPPLPWFRRTRNRRLLILAAILATLAALAVIPYPLYVTEECVLRPGKRADARAGTSGIIAEVLVDEGDEVQAGQPLARLDDRDVEFGLRQARAEVDRLKAELLKLERGNRPEEIAKTRAMVAARAREAAFAKKQAARQRKMARAGVVSRSVRDEAVRDRQVQGAMLAEARADLRLLKSGSRSEDVAIAQAQLRAAEAQVDYLEAQSQLLVIKAPIAGRVLTPRFRERVHEKVNPGDVVCELGDLRKVAGEVLVPERHGDVITLGQPVEVKIYGFPLRPYHGKVTFIAPVVEERDGSRILRVETVLDNADGALQPRMTGFAEIDAGQRSILALASRRFVRWLRVRFVI
jgi:putative peptide zinc metalloprotease protein